MQGRLPRKSTPHVSSPSVSSSPSPEISRSAPRMPSPLTFGDAFSRAMQSTPPLSIRPNAAFIHLVGKGWPMPVSEALFAWKSLPRRRCLTSPLFWRCGLRVRLPVNKYIIQALSAPSFESSKSSAPSVLFRTLAVNFSFYPRLP